MTTGNDLVDIKRFLEPGRTSYTAAEVVGDLLGSKDADNHGAEAEVLQAAGVGSLK